jgi:hypothetical protein
MPVYLQRVRFTVHTKKQFLAGTNSLVKLCYEIEERHVHPKLEPGVHCTDLDHAYHDDFQSGKADSYEVSFGAGKLGKAFQGHPVLNGLQFDNLDEAKQMRFHLRIEGDDQWIFDRCALGGYFMEVRPVSGKTDEYEEVELGWVEMAKHSGDVEMSSDPDEGCQEYPIELNGSFR